jgi:tRNA pseudouridine13 synthase
MAVEEIEMETQQNKKIKLDKMDDKVHILLEKDFGISLYVNNTCGFSGTIKHRYSDFHVHEIDVDGNILHLNEWKEPQQQTTATKEELNEDQIQENLLSWFEEENVARILSKNFSETILSREITEKTDRTKVHRFFKLHLGYCITETDSTRIKVLEKTGQNAKRDKSRNTPNMRYISVNVYKENKDTTEVVQRLASFLRLRNSDITYAGNKDKRGITVQKMVIENSSVDRLRHANERIHQVCLSDAQKADKPLKLGDLQGNHFRIVIRCVEDLKSAEEGAKLLYQGFINYFGMQRFGTSNVPTSDIGVLLFQEKYKEAAELILAVKSYDDETTRDARNLWINGRDAKGCLKSLPRRNASERQILEYFVKQNLDTKNLTEQDYQNAINNISWDTRTMYVHSFQSLVWNNMVTKRIQLYGFKPVVGDLVQKDGVISAIETEEELAKFDITDIVLPLPGHQVQYPKNSINEEYEKLMRQYNIKIDKTSNKLLNLPGSYRCVIVKPKDLDYVFAKYTDSNQALIQSDYEKLKGDEGLNGEDMLKGDEPKQEEQLEEKNAMILSFSLPSSSYATMLLRELMKVETSSQYQRLN